MAKLVVLVMLVVVAVWWLRAARRPISRDDPAAPPAPPQAVEGEAMVGCAQCGLHLPRSEALPGRGGFFCSEAHRAAFETANGA